MSEKFILLDENATWKGKAHFQCKTCGHVVYKSTQFVKHKHNLKCDNCFAIAKAEKEKQHRLEIQKRKEERKKQSEINKINKQKSQENPKPIYIIICVECGKKFETLYNSAKYCSDKCRHHAYNKKYKSHKECIHKERAIKYNVSYDPSINIKELIDRDNGICALCGKPIDINDGHWANGVWYTGLNYPTIDHIIPMSKGGSHTWNNVQLAHMICNSSKSDKLRYDDK